MLLDDFYTILKVATTEEQALEVTVDIHKDHAIFKGHFPNYPVTPGVAMLQIIKNCLESHVKYSLPLQSSSTIKFLSLVNPYEQNVLLFSIQYSIVDNLIKVKNVTSFRDGSSVLKCNATFVKK